MKIIIIYLIFFFVLFTTPAFAQTQEPPDNGNEETCQSNESSFEGLLLLIHANLDQDGGEKDPHLSLPPFEALFGIGSGTAISANFVLIPPLPAPAMPQIIEVENPTLYGLNNACETIEVSEDPN